MNGLTRVVPWAVVVGVLLLVLLRRRGRPGRPGAWRGALGALLAWAGVRRQPGDFPGAVPPAVPGPARRARVAVNAGSWLVAAREVRERIRGRLFLAGTVLILAGVSAAIVVPVLVRGKPHTQRVGVVGPLSAPLRGAVADAATGAGVTARLTPEAGAAAARDGLRTGRLDLAVIDGREVLVDKAITATDTSPGTQFARELSRTLGDLEALRAAGLTASQARLLAGARPVPVDGLQPSGPGAGRATSDAGLVLVFLMLTQYNTWTLIGVMEEKSSRVAEVLLAAIRPARLLAGKVLGIGLVAFAQAALVAAVAAGVAAAVGSGLLRGTAPWVLAGALAWLVLGYAFYCWAYAAVGSLAERRDQVQSLILPLSLPVIFGAIAAQTALTSGHASTLVQVLAYLPPTAPLAMPALVGLGAVTWWEFLASAVFSVLSTAGAAMLATGIYRRAILRTGHRVRLGEVLPGAAR